MGGWGWVGGWGVRGSRPGRIMRNFSQEGLPGCGVTIENYAYTDSAT